MNKNPWVETLKFLGIGWYIAISIVLGVVAGLFLDRWLGSSPWFTVGGLLFGIAAAIWGVYRIVAPLLKNKNGRRGKE